MVKFTSRSLMQRDEKMYLWFEEMGLINEPKKRREDQIAEFLENMKIVARKNKKRRRNDAFFSRERAV